MRWKKNEAQNNEARIEKLAEEIRSAAYKSVEGLWSAFLEVGELDMLSLEQRRSSRSIVGGKNNNPRSSGDSQGRRSPLERAFGRFSLAGKVPGGSGGEKSPGYRTETTPPAPGGGKSDRDRRVIPPVSATGSDTA